VGGKNAIRVTVAPTVTKTTIRTRRRTFVNTKEQPETRTVRAKEFRAAVGSGRMPTLSDTGPGHGAEVNASIDFQE